QAGVLQPAAAGRDRRGLPRVPDHHGAPVGAVAGRGQLDRHAQVERVHRPLRLVAQVLPGVAGEAVQLGAAGQGALRHRLPADHPAEVAGRLRGSAAEGRGAAEDPQGQRRAPAGAGRGAAMSAVAEERAGNMAEQFYPSDQYGYATLLTDAERGVLARLRTVLEEQVHPLLGDYWEQGEFPYQIAQP